MPEAKWCMFHVFITYSGYECICVYFMASGCPSVDLLRIEKTSGDIVRERMKCEINRVLIGSVSDRFFLLGNTPCLQKRPTLSFSVSSPNINQFSNFFTFTFCGQFAIT